MTEIDKNLVKELDEHDSKVDDEGYKKLTEQIQQEYRMSVDYLTPKWKQWGERLRLYNNQMRIANSVGDPLIFTILQTVLANLYDDRLMVSFQPRDQGDEDTSDNITRLARYGYEIMEKDQLDYDWDWDTLFYGKGLILFNYFNRKKEVMSPLAQVIDPTTFLRDPRAYSVNGNVFGQNRLRFCGWESEATKPELEMSGQYSSSVLDQLKGKSENTIIDHNRDERASAQGYANKKTATNLIKDNEELKILKWYTVYKGKRVYVELGNQMKLVLKYEVQDDFDIPIIERQIFRMPHDWDGTSLPDLLEDKQKAKALLMNLSLDNATSGLHKRYAYNPDALYDKNDLNYAQDKHIGVKSGFDPSRVIIPVQHQSISDEVSWIMNLIEENAQKSSAAPSQQQGMQGQQGRTATELMQVNKGSDTRFSLGLKTFQWSEKRFWNQWYKLIKKHFKDGIDGVTIRISGALNNEWRELTRENLICKIDPDISIESDMLAEGKRIRAFQAMTNYMNVAMTYPNANKLFTIREYGRISGLDQELIDAMIPPTVDEMDANKENEDLNKNKKVMVDTNDDHQTHLVIHAKANDTKARQAHIEAHQKGLMVQKIEPPMAQQASQAAPAAESMQETSQPIQSNSPVIRQGA